MYEIILSYELQGKLCAIISYQNNNKIVYVFHIIQD